MPTGQDGHCEIKRNDIKKIKVFDYREYVKVAIAYAKDGESDKAISYYLKAIDLVPASSDLHYNLAIGYLKIHDYRRAEREFKRAISFNSDNKDAYYNLGVLY